MGALAFCFEDELVAANDNASRLTRATKADGNVLNFRYDGDGLRMETIKNSTGTTPNLQFAGGVHTRYVTSATEELADLDGNRAVISRYVAGPAIDERVAQVDANGAVTYIHTDKQNSVIALTNATGNAISRRGYGEYGQTSAAQMAETTHPFGYTGRRYEAELGLYYYRARWYDPELGTFLETDPIGSLDYINLYSYVGLDPMGKTDPSGMCRFPAQGNIPSWCPPNKGGSPKSSGTAGSNQTTSATNGGNNRVSWPVAPGPNGKVVITDHFGAPRSNGRRHGGTDFRNPVGGRVFAPQDGTVARVFNGGEGGNSIIILNNDGSKNGFAHTAPTSGIAVGTSVASGQTIGVSDGSGAGPPHLHLTFRTPDGVKVNPMSTQFRGVAGSCVKNVNCD